MKPIYAIFAALAATSIVALAADSLSPLPEAWKIAGKSPDLYVASIDHAQTVTGKGSKYLRSIGKDGSSWGTLMQMFSAEKYLGQRVRFQARIKTKDVSNWAGLWMRIDAPGGGTAFYNSQDKPIKGTTDWQLRTVVLDVGPNARAIALGVIEGGTGEVWIDDIKLEVVDRSVKADAISPGGLAKAPSL